MITPLLRSTVVRLAAAGACSVALSSCGGELLRTGRAPVYLVVTNVTTAAGGGGGSTGAFLQSDVQRLVDGRPTIFNDTATVTFRVDAKNSGATTAPVNAVTLTRYRVVFRRTDGRNTPGVDVPYGFDGGLTASANAGGTMQAAFEIVRHQAKLEPPLANLSGLGGQIFISTIAEVTFYGRDQNGNEVTATANIDVHFGDFSD